jgi:hypothetical protein
MLLPVLKDEFSILGITIVGILFLPNIFYSVITIQSRFLSWICIPAIFLCILQIASFHDYSKWIVSSSTACITLCIIPFYEFGVFIIVYSILFLFSKLYKNFQENIKNQRP